MRKSRFTETQIIGILKSVEAGRLVKDVCREHSVSEATYYQWKSKYGGMEASDIKRLKKVYRAYCQLKMNLRRIGKKRLPSRHPRPLAVPVEINKSWSIDFMSDALWCGRRFRTLNVVDDFNREVLAIEIDLNLPASRVIRVLERIVAWRGFPEQIRTDNGPEFISASLADWAQKHEIHLEPGKPMQNGFIERFNRSYRQGVLDMYVFKSLQEVKERTEQWMNDYNEQCPHDSLDGMTPVEYRLFHQPQNSSNTWH